MSEPQTSTGAAGWTWLPEWARPRASERHTPGGTGTPTGTGGAGSLRLAETTLLVLFGLLLAVATVNDVARQGRVNHRLIADLRTWRAVTGHDYKDVGVEQDYKQHSTHETACGNVAPGAPKARTQICLRLAGPVLGGYREVTGGYYLPPYLEEDQARRRYGCFGSAAQAKVCPHDVPPPGAPPAPPLKLGRP